MQHSNKPSCFTVQQQLRPLPLSSPAQFTTATITQSLGSPGEMEMNKLPVFYTNSMSICQAQPIGPVIPQNIRPPQNKVAAGMGPAEVPSILTGSPFFHPAPSSPHCPSLEAGAPTLAAVQPLIKSLNFEQSLLNNAACAPLMNHTGGRHDKPLSTQDAYGTHHVSHTEEGKPNGGNVSQEELRVITIPHKHAATYNQTVRMIIRRLKAAGKLSATCPLGLILHQKLQAQQQHGLSDLIKRVNKNAEDAVRLSRRWQSLADVCDARTFKGKEGMLEKKETVYESATRESSSGASTSSGGSRRSLWKEQPTNVSPGTYVNGTEKAKKRFHRVYEQTTNNDISVKNESRIAAGARQCEEGPVSTVSDTASSVQGEIDLKDLLILPGPPPALAWFCSPSFPPVNSFENHQMQSYMNASGTHWAKNEHELLQYTPQLQDVSRLNQPQHCYPLYPQQVGLEAQGCIEQQQVAQQQSELVDNNVTCGSSLAAGQENDDAILSLRHQLEKQELKVQHLESLLTQQRPAQKASLPMSNTASSRSYKKRAEQSETREKRCSRTESRTSRAAGKEKSLKAILGTTNRGGSWK